MNNRLLRYYFFTVVLFVSQSLISQTNNEAGVTIIGDAPQSNSYYSNASAQNPPTPLPQQSNIQTNFLIEPSLDNGFHVRFQVTGNPPMDSYNSSKSSYSGSSGMGSVSKSRKNKTSISEKSFNIKKRLKKWLPKRKKRYRPNLCGRF